MEHRSRYEPPDSWLLPLNGAVVIELLRLVAHFKTTLTRLFVPRLGVTSVTVTRDPTDATMGTLAYNFVASVQCKSFKFSLGV